MATALSIVVLTAEDSLIPVILPPSIVYCASKVSNLVTLAPSASLNAIIWLVTSVIAAALISPSPDTAAAISIEKSVPNVLTCSNIARSDVDRAVNLVSTDAIAFVLKRFCSFSESTKSLLNDALKLSTLVAFDKLAVFNVVNLVSILEFALILVSASIPNKRALSAASSAIALTLLAASSCNSAVVANPSVLNSLGIESDTACISDALAAASSNNACSLAVVSTKTASFTVVLKLDSNVSTLVAAALVAELTASI